MQPVLVNARVLKNPPAARTGAGRYLREILSRLDDRVIKVTPRRWTHGWAAHLWEQAILPRLARGSILWSPVNSGPVNAKYHVVTVHHLLHDHEQTLNPRFAMWYRFLTPKLIARASFIIVPSHFSRNRILELFPKAEEKTVVVPNGVGAAFLPRSQHEIQTAMRELHLPTGRYVLFVGTLEPRKNLARLIAAWRKIEPILPSDIWLFLAGPNATSRVCRSPELGDLSGRVKLLGYVRDTLLPAVYSGAVAVAYVSLHEGFGLPALEAMACGTAVVTSNVTALPEVVGDGALTVDPLSVEAIAEALLFVITNDQYRCELARKAISRARMFSWEKSAEMTWSVLRRAAG